VAAGLATLSLVREPGFFERLSATTEKLVQGLTDAAQQAGVAFSGTSLGGMFGIFFSAAVPTDYAQVMACDRERFSRFFHAMLKRGIYLAPSAYEAGFVSAAHGNAEIERTIAAAREVFATLDQA
jgi:glutamate-1-semialdehyde 2,1-aminomutase